VAYFLRRPVDSSALVPAATGVQSLNGDTRAMIQSLSASFVRIDAPESADRDSPVRIVLSIDSSDILDFMDAYRDGFTAAPTR